MKPTSVLEEILNLARWAPSGDNSQPWRFEIVDGFNVVIHGFDTRDHCVYDLDGWPSQVSLGALLETLSIAGSGHGLAMKSRRRDGLPDTKPTFDIEFVPDAARRADSLVACITQRSVQRRPLSSRSLTPHEKQALEASVGDDHRIVWLEGLGERFRVARLMFNNAKLRLTMPEAYTVHRDIIQWNARFSQDRVPDQALGIDPLTSRLMRWALASWSRVHFLNTYLAGTLAPRVQMDLIPGLACAAHFLIMARTPPRSIDDFVAGGRAVQRFWLTTTQLGLFQQPEMTPLIFSSYVRNRIPFTRLTKLQDLARELETATTKVVGADVDHAVWMGRLGAGTAPRARSTRRPLDQLMHAPTPPQPAITPQT